MIAELELPYDRIGLISDLHLSWFESQKQEAQFQTKQQTSCTESRHSFNLLAAFLHFMQTEAPQLDALIILGDWFEYWVGDDAISHTFPALNEIIQACRKFTATGKTLYFMYGNRDFLLGEDFAKTIEATKLTDPCIINTPTGKWLLSHGDHLCRDDVAYQQFRQTVRSSKWQQNFLSQSLDDRLKEVAQMREASKKHHQEQPMAMDVNIDEADRIIEAANLQSNDRLSGFIHGHTHLPKVHTHTIDNHKIHRYVLGDWRIQSQHVYSHWLKLLSGQPVELLLFEYQVPNSMS